MNAVGQANTTMQSVRTALTTYPVIVDSTLYNTDFIPKDSYINTIPEDYHPSEEVVANDKYGVARPRTFKQTFDVLNEELKTITSIFNFMSY